VNHQLLLLPLHLSDSTTEREIVVVEMNVIDPHLVYRASGMRPGLLVILRHALTVRICIGADVIRCVVSVAEECLAAVRAVQHCTVQLFSLNIPKVIIDAHKDH
jgi:hypothetical protein